MSPRSRIVGPGLRPVSAAAMPLVEVCNVTSSGSPSSCSSTASRVTGSSLPISGRSWMPAAQGDRVVEVISGTSHSRATVADRHGPFATRETRTIAGVQRVEFFIEPFEEGRPGPHVTAAVDAVTAAGGDVDFGAFSSTCPSRRRRDAGVVAALLEAAFAARRDNVRLSVDRVDP